MGAQRRKSTGETTSPDWENDVLVHACWSRPRLPAVGMEHGWDGYTYMLGDALPLVCVTARDVDGLGAPAFIWSASLVLARGQGPGTMKPLTRPFFC
jgi:hypothetical protein